MKYEDDSQFDDYDDDMELNDFMYEEEAELNDLEGLDSGVVNKIINGVKLNRKKLLVLAGVIMIMFLILVGGVISISLEMMRDDTKTSTNTINTEEVNNDPSGQVGEFYKEMEDPYPIDRSNPDYKDLEETKEYQIKLNVNKFVNKQEGIQEFLSYLREYTHFPFSEETAFYSIREELQITTESKSNCLEVEKYKEIRIRNYKDGWNKGNSVLDIKYSPGTNDKERVVPVNMLPNQNFYYNTSILKVEQDYHRCNNKYSKKSKVTNFPYNYRLSTCYDLQRYFPDAFEKMTDSIKYKTLDYEDPTYWYLYQHQGYINNTYFLSAFTLIYDNIEDAAEDAQVTPNDHDSEFSIRIWSDDQGKKPFDYDRVAYFDDLYEYIIENIGSYHDEFKCATVE